MIPLHDDNPTSINPIVTVGLIATCILVFFWQLGLGPEGNQRIVFSLGMIPVVLFHETELPSGLDLVPPEFTVITSMFLHGGWMHLIGNMLYLWIFGNNVEDAMGHGRFLVFYLLCGILAALGQAVLNPMSTLPMIGASGAISGVLGAYLLLYPHARILVLVPIGLLLTTVSMRAFWVLVFWFALQLLYSTVGDPTIGGVAWFAHIGGFVAGMALIPLFKHRKVHLLNPPHHTGRGYQ
ncbi:MAG: rhomboid family intramembrane serine protease [Gammaproteobacteria bacterium]|nr:rhomboid family intramembrane serine protease [Gammaproteobacteria bacterium]MCI0590379.1 rhomboid family intramembrane serine protease [Gammaproteobacteria bacterium]